MKCCTCVWEILKVAKKEDWPRPRIDARVAELPETITSSRGGAYCLKHFTYATFLRYKLPE